jgi:hypothetical protein
MPEQEDQGTEETIEGTWISRRADTCREAMWSLPEDFTKGYVL